MKLRARLLRFACLPLWIAASPHATLAAERGCAFVTIEADAGFSQQYRNLLPRLQSELALRSDVDACAHVELTVLDHGLINVSVTLRDGRSASRSVESPEDVLPTVEGLLLVPEPALVVAPTAESPSLPDSKGPSRTPRNLRFRDTETSAPEAALRPRSLGVELSVVVGSRIGDGQFGYGGGVLSFAEVSRWLIGFQGRVDGYRAIRGGDAETALALAVLVGRRFTLDTVALDINAGPGVALEGVTISQTEAVRTSNPPSTTARSTSAAPEPTADVMPRFLIGARLGFTPRSLFRTFVGIDGEFGPVRNSESEFEYLAMSSPRMPRYVIGISVGATVGTP